MATELGAWPEYEEEDWGSGYDTMSGTSIEVSLYLLLPGSGSRGHGGPDKAHIGAISITVKACVCSRTQSVLSTFSPGQSRLPDYELVHFRPTDELTPTCH